MPRWPCRRLLHNGLAAATLGPSPFPASEPEALCTMQQSARMTCSAVLNPLLDRLQIHDGRAGQLQPDGCVCIPTIRRHRHSYEDALILELALLLRGAVGAQREVHMYIHLDGRLPNCPYLGVLVLDLALLLLGAAGAQRKAREAALPQAAQKRLDRGPQAHVHDRVHALVDGVHDEGDGCQACSRCESPEMP